MSRLRCAFCHSEQLTILPETDDKGQIYRCEKCKERMHPLESFPVLPKTQEPFMRLLHVGGRQNYIGPAQNLLKLFGNAMELYVCEADPEVKNAGIEEGYDERYQTKVFTLPYCLYNRHGEHDFHINKDPDSSSLLPSYPYAKKDFNTKVAWGDVTQAIKTITLRTETVNGLIHRGIIKKPHFISLDTQGVEYDILDKASAALKEETIGVVTEVEFHQLYQDQHLFGDISKLLNEWGFRLFRLYNMETWYPTDKCTVGDGMLTVAEALFLRDWRWYFTSRGEEGNPANLWALPRLVGAAVAFNQWSYAYEIIERINAVCPELWEHVVKKNEFWFCDINVINKIKEGV